MKMLPPPGPARTRKLALLAVLGVVAVFVSWQYLGGSPAAGPSLASNTPPKAGAAPPINVLPEKVQLDKLEPVPGEPGTTRNPFRFGVKPEPPRPPQPVVVAPPAPPPVQPGPPPPPPVPKIPLKFIGRVVMPDAKVIASLTDGLGNILQGGEGQIIDGRYRIVKIGEETLVIEWVNGTGRTTLQLRGS